MEIIKFNDYEDYCPVCGESMTVGKCPACGDFEKKKEQEKMFREYMKLEGYKKLWRRS